MRYIGAVGCDHGTLAKRQIIQGIEQICLSHAVAADKTIYFRRKRDVDIGQIPIIKQREPVYYHFRNTFAIPYMP